MPEGSQERWRSGKEKCSGGAALGAGEPLAVLNVIGLASSANPARDEINDMAWMRRAHAELRGGEALIESQHVFMYEAYKAEAVASLGGSTGG